MVCNFFLNLVKKENNVFTCKLNNLQNEELQKDCCSLEFKTRITFD